MSEDNELKGLIELGWFGELPSEQKPVHKVERTDKQRLIELIQLCKDLRDEVVRLRGLLAEIQHDCEHVGSIQHLDKAERRTWVSVANRIKAALTPQAGKGGESE